MTDATNELVYVKGFTGCDYLFRIKDLGIVVIQERLNIKRLGQRTGGLEMLHLNRCPLVIVIESSLPSNFHKPRGKPEHVLMEVPSKPQLNVFARVLIQLGSSPVPVDLI